MFSFTNLLQEITRGYFTIAHILNWCMFFELNSHRRNRPNPFDILEKRHDIAKRIANTSEELSNNVGMVLDDFYLKLSRPG